MQFSMVKVLVPLITKSPSWVVAFSYCEMRHFVGILFWSIDRSIAIAHFVDSGMAAEVAIKIKTSTGMTLDLLGNLLSLHTILDYIKITLLERSSIAIGIYHSVQEERLKTGLFIIYFRKI